MKCTNMKIAEIIFFIANLITINTSVVRQDKISRTSVAISKEASTRGDIHQNCSHLIKTIEERKLTNYTMNCELSEPKDRTVDVLQHACFVVYKMLSFSCDNKLNEAVLDLLGRNNINEICPFDFSHLEHLGFGFDNHDAVKQLTDADFCQGVCYLMYGTHPQCILLSKFNNYLKTQVAVPHPEVDKPVSLLVSQVTDLSSQKTDESVAVHTSQKQVLSNKSRKDEPIEMMNETKAETPVSQLSEPVKTSVKASEESDKGKKPVTVAALKAEFKPSEKGELKPAEEVEPPREEEDIKPPELDNDETPLDDGLTNEDIQALRYNKKFLNQKKEFLRKSKLEEKHAYSIRDPIKEKDAFIGEGFSQAEDSHFFFYFIMVSSVVVVGYLAFHNKNKILAYALEGSSNRRSRRRPNPARYRKLETNLEEAISSNATNATTSSVVY